MCTSVFHDDEYDRNPGAFRYIPEQCVRVSPRKRAHNATAPLTTVPFPPASAFAARRKEDAEQAIKIAALIHRSAAQPRFFVKAVKAMRRASNVRSYPDADERYAHIAATVETGLFKRDPAMKRAVMAIY